MREKMKTKKKNIVEKSLTKFQELSIIRKDKRYLIKDEEPIYTLNEFRNFQKFLENMIMLSRHKNIIIKGALLIEKIK